MTERGTTPEGPAASDMEVRRLLQELQVHQVELEAQNQELRASRLELERSRTRYFDLFDMAPVSYCVVGRDGRILEANRTMEGILGVPVDTLTGRVLARFVSPADQSLYQEAWVGFFTHSFAKPVELRLQRGDGTRRWVCLEASPEAEPTRCSERRLVLLDISERKRREASWELERARLRMLLAVDRMPDGPFEDIGRYVSIECARETESALCLYGVFEADGALLFSMYSKRETDPVVAVRVQRSAWEGDLWGDSIPRREAVSLENPEGAATGVFGVLPGVPPLRRLLMAPVLVAGTRSAVICLANKVEEYSEDEGRYLRLVAEGLGSALSRRKDREALRASLDRLSRIQRAAGAGLWEWNLQTNEHIWSEGLRALFRVPETTQASLETLRALTHPEDVELQEAAVARIIEQRVPFSIEHRYLRSEGGIGWVHVSAGLQYDDEGSPLNLAGIVVDVTERKRIELAHRELVTRHHELVERITNGVAVYRAVDDGSGFVFVDLNPAGERISNVRREDVLGRSVIEVFPAAQDMGLLAAFQRVWRTGAPESLPAILYKDARLEQWVSNSLFRLPSGEVVAVYEDVTGAKAAEQRILGFSRQLLGAREDERRSLATALHHELGSLSVSVSVRLDAAADLIAAKDQTVALSFVEDCRVSLRDAVARLKAIALDLRPPDLELLGLSTALRQHFTRLSGDTGLQIQFTDALGEVVLDEATAIALFRIGQEALTNVVRHAGASWVSVRLSWVKSGVRLSVRDDGCGFDPEQVLDRVEGNMGLITIHEIARSLHGVLEVRSWAGRGTLVIATLPRERRAP